MQPPEHLTPSTAEERFITEGPNSGGIAGWLLHEGHLFSFWQDFGGGDIGPGIPVAEWIERYRERHPEIVAALRAR